MTTGRATNSEPPPKSATSLFNPPPKATALAGWALLPLRVFLGVTFLFAGLQKLANPDFFNAKSPSSIQAQMAAADRLSPIHALTSHLTSSATALGVIIAIGEIAVGVGALLGLWTRIAALGGALLALMLFLTVSFHSSPFYTGADIVFFFAWLPLLIAGSGGVLSVDGAVARRASAEAGRGDPTSYALSFATIQTICGRFEDGRCSAQAGAPCGPSGCPVLAGTVETPDQDDAAAGVKRRTLILGSTAAAIAAGIAGLGAAAVAVAGRSAHGSSDATGGNALSTTTSTSTSTSTSSSSSGAGSTTTTQPAIHGTPIGEADQVPVGGSGTFTAPNGDPGIVIRPAAAEFVAYDAVCPHAGCTVGYSKAAKLIVCPCHGSEFEVATGDVIAGPAPHGLTKFDIATSESGELYIES